jgi:hypothetical protein
MVDRSAEVGDRTLRLAVALLLCLALVTCGGVPASPSGPRREYIGTWVGSISHPTAGTGTLTVTIEEGRDGFFDSGTWSSAFSEVFYNDRGTVQVTIAGQSPGNPLFILWTSRTCQGIGGHVIVIDFIVTATIVNDRMTGNFTEEGCTLPFTQGTLDVRRH